jgi:uncharacterized protein (DUF1499 family)
VSSAAPPGDARHHVAPLPAAGEPAAAFARARAAALALPRTTLAVDEPGYVRVECRSAVFGFVDDLELLLDAEARVIHVRSAARLGRSDFGVNRARVERLRRAL